MYIHAIVFYDMSPILVAIMSQGQKIIEQKFGSNLFNNTFVCTY